MIPKGPIQIDALAFLRENATAVVATSFEGQPHASVVYYDVDDDFNLFFLTKRNTHKNIHTGFDPHVAVVIGFGPERINVQIRGTARVLLESEKIDAVAKMIARYTQLGITALPIAYMKELKGKFTLAMKVVPEELVFMNMECVRYPRSIASTFHRFCA